MVSDVATKNRQAFKRAKRVAGDTDIVCGFHDPEGNPHYFVVPRDASEEEIRRRAFEAKHQRPMNRAESLLDAALSGDFVRAFESTMAHYFEGRDDAVDGGSAPSV